MPYAHVALPLVPRRLFTYEVEAGQAAELPLGQRVLAPFGHRTLLGTFVGWDPNPPPGVRLRRLVGPAGGFPPLPADLLELTRWAAEYYLVSWGAMIEAAAPTLLHLRRRVSLWPGPVMDQNVGQLESEVLAAVSARPGLRLQTLQKKFPAQKVLQALAELGRGGRVVRREELVPLRRRSRDTPVGCSRTPPAAMNLNADQSVASTALKEAIEARQFKSFLLKGVTGSGKTEVYLEGIRRALGLGLQALYLVPEIGLTPLLAARLSSEFGSDLAVLHSGLGGAARSDAWTRLAGCQAKLVLGTRSAVFAPLPRPGLIVVDEEQDPSYKQDESPRYHARDLALVRARQVGVPIVLGSATPALETYQRAVSRRIQVLELRQRVDGRPLPEVEIIDMREELGREGGRGPVLSNRLTESLRAVLSEGSQAILLLNRRGYAAHLICRACGKVVQCARCSVGMPLHRREQRLRCHYCGRTAPIPDSCPSCNAKGLALGSEGTERLEDELERELPGARRARLDSDMARASGRSVERVLSAFHRGEIQLLLGTQMVAKGHDFPNVTLVGVLCADDTLGLPDFRSAERTYQLIHQVSGRAGRGSRPGRVLVQTFAPDHYAVRYGASQNYEAFFEHETRYRKGLRYPPFSVLAQLLLTDRDVQRGSKRARVLAERVRAGGGVHVRVLGPALAPLARLRGKYRFQILVKGGNRLRVNHVLRESLASLEAERFPLSNVVVDVDPVSTL